MATALLKDEQQLRNSLADSRAKLLAVRERRVHPGLDDKVLVAWNGLMIDALAQAAGVLDEPRYLSAAQRAAEFCLTHMRRHDGRLLHTWREGQAKLDAYLDDYTSLANGLISLYEADFDERWIGAAIELVDEVLARFIDSERGGFFYTATDHETLIARQKDFYDNAVPSGNSMAAMALVRLGKLTGRGEYLEAAEGTLRAAAELLERAPQAGGQLLLALDLYFGPTPEIVVLGNPDEADTAESLAALRHRFVPNQVVACRPGDAGISGPLDGLFDGKSLAGPEPAVFVCEDFACQAPEFGKDAALAIWQRLSQGGATP